MPLKTKLLFLVAGLCALVSDLTQYLNCRYHVQLGGSWFQLLNDRAGDAGSGVIVLIFMRLLFEQNPPALISAVLFSLFWEAGTQWVTKGPFDYEDVVVFSIFASAAHLVLEFQAERLPWHWLGIRSRIQSRSAENPAIRAGLNTELL